MSDAELKPCPFCGGEAHHIRAVNGSNLIYTGCKSCRVRYEATYGKHDYFDTVAAWNTRHNPITEALCTFDDNHIAVDKIDVVLGDEVIRQDDVSVYQFNEEDEQTIRKALEQFT